MEVHIQKRPDRSLDLILLGTLILWFGLKYFGIFYFYEFCKFIFGKKCFDLTILRTLFEQHLDYCTNCWSDVLQECVDKTWSCHERGDGGADPGGDLAQDNGHGARRQDVRVSIVTIMVIIWSEVATWCHGMGTMIHNPWDTPSLKAIMHCLVLLVVKLLLYAN